MLIRSRVISSGTWRTRSPKWKRGKELQFKWQSRILSTSANKKQMLGGTLKVEGSRVSMLIWMTLWPSSNSSKSSLWVNPRSSGHCARLCFISQTTTTCLNRQSRKCLNKAWRIVWHSLPLPSRNWCLATVWARAARAKAQGQVAIEHWPEWKETSKALCPTSKSTVKSRQFALQNISCATYKTKVRGSKRPSCWKLTRIVKTIRTRPPSRTSTKASPKTSSSHRVKLNYGSPWKTNSSLLEAEISRGQVNRSDAPSFILWWTQTTFASNTAQIHCVCTKCS